MQFRNLRKQYEAIKSQIDEAMVSVATSAHFIAGSEVKELEKVLAEYVGVKHCISYANGTDALSLALMAWEIGPGDAVFPQVHRSWKSGAKRGFWIFREYDYGGTGKRRL